MVEIENTEDVDPVTEKRNWLVNQWMDAKASIVKHQEVADQYAEQLIAELGAGGRHELAPGVGVKVLAPSMVFDAELARQVLTPEQYDSICDRKPSSTLAAKMLPGVLVDQCKKQAARPSLRPITNQR